MAGRLYPPKPEAVYFFGTCIVDLFFPKAGLAGMELLRRNGLRVIYPQDQSCCGQPAFNSGYPDEARQVAAAQMALFPKRIPIVLPSGSCAGMMRKHYPELFPGEAQAAAFADRVFELSEFLLHVLDFHPQDLGPPITVTWHGSCHALREMGIDEEPKTLLKRLGYVTLAPLQRERECCGFGGTFAVKRPEVSGAMVADKVADAEATGAEVLLSGDCGCLMNMGGALEKKGSPLQARHLAEFLLERLSDER
ncbi:MAG: (Fe-S)-binding protein [Magnetospiraceae bacterium]